MFIVKKTKQMAVPIIQIGEAFIIGYNPEGMKEELKKQNVIE